MGIAQRSTAAIPKQITARRRKAKATLKSSTIAIYASIFALLVVIVGLGYHAPEKETTVASATAVNTYNTSEKASVNDVVATAIAADVASSTNLSVAPNAANLAVSAQIQSELIQSDASTIAKPQLVGTDGQVRAVISYVVKKSDTISSIADNFGISKQTIKWANGMASDAVSVGSTLKIPPVDGVLYTVKAGDTAESIAKKYEVDKTRLVLYNDLDLSGVKAGDQIILPSGTLPGNERPGYVAPVQYSSPDFSFGSGTVKYLYTVPYGVPSPGNTGTPGQCTWYVWDRRVKLGLRMPSNAVLGNAEAWDNSLGSRGYSVKRGVPSIGAIMQNGGGFGHVAIVEGIAENGDVTVTEMNYLWRSFVVTQRTISAGQAASPFYAYIQ